MASQRDKDYHKLRNPEKYGLDKGFYGRHSGGLTKEESESNERYDALWKKYGNRSMVGNKRRRNSTRKANQKTKAVYTRIARAKEKELLIQAKNTDTLDDLVIPIIDKDPGGWVN